ncbi:metal ABC transporter solute-binding protein, Zn/Mn family [Corynebacterium sp. 335C]
MTHSITRRAALLSGAAILTLGLAACATDDASGGGSAGAAGGDGGDGTLEIFATTGYLGDAVKNIAPDADVHVMVGPGGDPHTYQPTTQDLELLQQADLVVWTGLHMEAHMISELEAQGDRQIAVGDKLPEDQLLPWPETDDQGNPLHDPHIWNSTDNWKMVAGFISDKLGEVDPDNKDAYAENAEKFQGEIDEVAEYVQGKVDTIPEEQRYLITGHDAFNYFGEQFGVEVKATDFVTSESEMTAADIKELAKFIAEHKIPVIFQDNLQNPQAIESLKEAVEAEGWSVEISDKELYADSLGAEAPTDTYVGVVKYNADTIAEALGK